MKVYYKTVLQGDVAKTWPRKNGIWEYTLLEIADMCCPEMKDALDDRAIVFGDFDSTLNRDNNLNFAEYYPTKYCPFCGANVETEERERTILRNVKKVIPNAVIEVTEEVSLPLGKD